MRRVPEYATEVLTLTKPMTMIPIMIMGQTPGGGVYDGGGGDCFSLAPRKTTIFCRARMQSERLPPRPRSTLASCHEEPEQVNSRPPG